MDYTSYEDKIKKINISKYFFLKHFRHCTFSIGNSDQGQVAPTHTSRPTAYDIQRCLFMIKQITS